MIMFMTYGTNEQMQLNIKCIQLIEIRSTRGRVVMNSMAQRFSLISERLIDRKYQRFFDVTEICISESKLR